MNNSGLAFPKNERLSLKRHIDMLFQNGLSFVAYPLRVIYLFPKREEKDLASQSDSPVMMMVSVPKKKIRHAVDRNYIKRRVRESYRLRKHELIQACSETDKKLLLALIYLGTEKCSYTTIDGAMAKMIAVLRSKGETGKTER